MTIRALTLSFGLMAGLAASPAYAGSVEGKIEWLMARATDNLHFVAIIGQVKDSPACAAGRTYFIIKDENSRAGQSQFAQLLSAQLANRAVEIIGTGTCTRWPDGEDIGQINIK